MIHIKYTNSQPLGDMRFPVPAEMYINSVIERPRYPVQAEDKEDEEGDIHNLWQRWDKQHTIRFLAIESMADAISILPLMDEVYVNGERVFDVVPTITWEEEYHCLARCELRFSKKKVIKIL